MPLHVMQHSGVLPLGNAMNDDNIETSVIVFILPYFTIHLKIAVKDWKYEASYCSSLELMSSSCTLHEYPTLLGHFYHPSKCSPMYDIISYCIFDILCQTYYPNIHIIMHLHSFQLGPKIHICVTIDQFQRKIDVQPLYTLPET